MCSCVWTRASRIRRTVASAPFSCSAGTLCLPQTHLQISIQCFSHYGRRFDRLKQSSVHIITNKKKENYILWKVVSSKQFSVKISAVKRLITYEIKVFVYIIYMCVCAVYIYYLCMYIYIYTHTHTHIQYIFRKYFHVYRPIYISFILYIQIFNI